MNTILRGHIPVQGLPFFIQGKVIKGYGRGSAQLGIPTANLTVEEQQESLTNLPLGVYCGYARVDKGPIYKMAMSLGWNPFFKNEKKSMEIHILNKFDNDFYGSQLEAVIVEYIREEFHFNFVWDDLIREIKSDITYADEKLPQVPTEEVAKLFT